MDTYLVLKEDKFREGLKKILNIYLPRLKINTHSTLPKNISENIELIIIEPSFSLPDDNNIQLIGELANKGYPICAILGEANEKELLEIMSLKVRGIVFKTMGTKKIIDGINEVAYGGRYLPPKAASVLLEAYQE